MKVQGIEDEEIERDEARKGAPDVTRSSAKKYALQRDEVGHQAGVLLSV